MNIDKLLASLDPSHPSLENSQLSMDYIRLIVKDMDREQLLATINAMLDATLEWQKENQHLLYRRKEV